MVMAYGEDDGGFYRREVRGENCYPAVTDWCEECGDEFEICDCVREDEEEVDHGCREDNYWFGRE